MENKRIYEFGDYRLDTAERLLSLKDEPVNLSPKTFETLVVLVKNAGRLVRREELIRELWADAFVEEANLSVHISTLRKTLNTGGNFIETVPRSGYRFVAPVREIEQDALVIEKHTRSQIVIEEEIETDELETVPQTRTLPTRRNRFVPVLIAASLLVAVCIAGWWLAFPRLNNKTLAQADRLEIRSLAVLPFKNIGETGKDEEYLAVGLADALTTRLSNNRSFVVRPTSAVLKYEKAETDLTQAGRELQTEAVLSGTIQRLENRFRINVQLIRVSDGAAVWAEKFEETAANLLSLQDSISAQTVRALAARLSDEEKSFLAKQYTTNPEANKLYLQGRYLWNQRTPESLQKSVRFFEQAAEKDPNYALAFAGLADAYLLMGEYWLLAPNEAFAKARANAAKALEIDDGLAEAHTSLGYTLAFFDWDWTRAEKEFRRALELNPNYPTAHQWYGEFLTVTGRFNEAEAEFKRAQELDPQSLIIAVELPALYYVQGRFDEAIADSRKILEINPNFGYAYVYLWISLEQKGLEREAIEANVKGQELLGAKPELISLYRKALESGGINNFWQESLKIATAPRSAFNYYQRAMMALRIGKPEEALDYLEKSAAARERWILNLGHDAQWKEIRNDSRFARIVQKLNLPS